MNTKYLAVSLVAAASHATSVDVKLMYDFWLSLDTETCSLQVGKNQNIFWQSDSSFLRSGQGNADSVTIMQAGNIINFPSVTETLSQQALDCNLIWSQSLDQATITGTLPFTDGTQTQFNVSFTVAGQQKLEFSAQIDRQSGNWFSVDFLSALDEEIYGLGLQYTEWNFKNKTVPLIVAEGGVGRGLQPITREMSVGGTGGGGNTLTSYGPTASFITNKQRAFQFSNSEIGIAKFEGDFTEILYWHTDKIEGNFFIGDNFMELTENLSQSIGTMKSLPSWIQQGAVIGIVGGQEFVEEKYKKMKDLGLPIVGMWMQDWVGEHDFTEGTRLLWNWQLNRSWYYDWDGLCDEWELDGVRPFVYINPYIADLSSFGVDLRENQYQIGIDNDYFVKNANGEVYLIKSISIQFAMVDFTNPNARNWVKEMIKTNLVAEGRAGGWMHDFGEYMPFDSVLASGVDPLAYHNKYAQDWASVAKEALSEVEGGDEIVYWMRSATGLSPKDTRLFWMGDQLTSYDKFDGLQSALIGQINSGISGFGLGHSDIGGYTVVNQPLVQKFLRGKELLQRWIEMCTFSDPIMRSHPSSSPDAVFQIWDDDETILFTKKFVEIHIALADYKAHLMNQHMELGRPFTRPLLLHFSEGDAVRKVIDEFMLGENVLMAPVFADGQITRSVFLPGPATWTHLWTREVYQVETELTIEVIAAPGEPAVFYRDTPDYQISSILSKFSKQTQQIQ